MVSILQEKNCLKLLVLAIKLMNSVRVFLRIADAKNPLDNTSVHPESYKTATLLLEKLGYSLEDITGGNLSDISQRIIELVPVEVKQEKLNISGKGFEALAALKNQRK